MVKEAVRSTATGLLLAVLLASGEAAAAPPSGLLLGRFEMSKHSYQTLWIYEDGAAIRVMAIPDLLVPRKQGFWRVGNYFTLQREEDFERPEGVVRRYLSEEEHIWALPVGAVPSVALAPGEQLSGLPTLESTCDHVYRKVNFVGPTHICYETVTGYECGVHPDGNSQMTVASLDRIETDRIDISEMFGDAGATAFRQALVAAVEEDRKEGGYGCEATEDHRNWNVVRTSGQWQIAGWASTARICNYGLDLRIPIPLPPALTGHDKPLLPWRELAAGIPELIDAFSSPNQDLLIAITKEAILAYRPAAGKLVPSVLRYPLRWSAGSFWSDRVVMAQWATDTPNVAKWTEQVGLVRAIKPVVRGK